MFGVEISQDRLWVGTLKVTALGAKVDDVWFVMDYDQTLTGEAKHRRLKRAKLIAKLLNKEIYDN